MKVQAIQKLSQSLRQFIVFAGPDWVITLPDHELNVLSAEAAASGRFSGKVDEIVPLVKGDKAVILIGLGPKYGETSTRKLGELTKQALQTPLLLPEQPVGILPPSDEEHIVRAIVDGAKLGLYKWDKYITSSEDEPKKPDFDIQIQCSHIKWVERYSLICDGVNLARDLGNENASVCTTDFLTDTIRSEVEGDARCTLEILEREELESRGFGLHLSVAQGSEQEPRLVLVTYKGADETAPYIAMIGKGLTYDTGGLNLKPTGSIESMRMDMCGAAAIIGTLRNTLALNLKCNVYFVCGLAENAIGPKAYKPGDVLVSYSGKTVEIGNTDAEGRLVLADANSYVATTYKPEAIINIATLTGAVIFALGYEYSGLMASDDQLAQQLQAAAISSDDRAWRLPMYSELSEHVKSTIADIKNTGQPRCAGTIAAGEFLRQFAQNNSRDIKWAHLDIAGTAKPKTDVGYFPSLATGAGVRLLTQFLNDRSEQK